MFLILQLKKWILLNKNSGENIEIFFKSKSFLQNQVRSMVGCLEHLSSNKWTVKKFKKFLNLKKDLIVRRQLLHVVCIYIMLSISLVYFLEAVFFIELKEIKNNETKFSKKFKLLNFLFIFHIHKTFLLLLFCIEPCLIL